MFYFIFVLCCKDTTKSNNYQIFKGKSYYIVYYLTFLNRKIKYYYLFTYYLLYYYYYILYVSYYIIYLIIYRERTKANGKGRAAPRRSAILPASSSSPSSSPPSGGEGRAASQPGRAILCLLPRRPSPPCRGVPWHKAVKFFLSSENQSHTRAAGALFQARKSPQILFLSLSIH